MKILMLVPFLPNIRTSGGQTRWFNIIKYLSIEHDITLFSLIKDRSEREFIPPLEKYCKKVRVFPRSKTPWTLGNVLKTGFGKYPFLVVRNLSIEEKKAIEEELESEKYDLIHAETFYVMPHIPDTSVPSVLVEQTIEYEVYRHYVLNEAPLMLRPVLMLDVFKLRFWEKFFWKKADVLVAVSPDDKKVMQGLIPGVKVDVIPNGVDAKHYTSKKVSKKSPPRVLYGVSNFEWLQNAEAANYLIEEVWPVVQRKVSEAKLWFAGRKIPQHIVNLSKERDDIEITESIPDSRDAYLGATVMTAPIYGSGGTRLKILEAMAAGLPVISTPIGVAGLGVKHGRDVLIADSTKSLASHTIDLLMNPKKAKNIGKSGQDFIKDHFDWPSIVKLHDPIYKKALK
ncbi:glycosyltransferase family 4 protein [Patescibacteria group bacterium]